MAAWGFLMVFRVFFQDFGRVGEEYYC